MSSALYLRWLVWRRCRLLPRGIDASVPAMLVLPNAILNGPAIMRWSGRVAAIAHEFSFPLLVLCFLVTVTFPFNYAATVLFSESARATPDAFFFFLCVRACATLGWIRDACVHFFVPNVFFFKLFKKCVCNVPSLAHVVYKLPSEIWQNAAIDRMVYCL